MFIKTIIYQFLERTKIQITNLVSKFIFTIPLNRISLRLRFVLLRKYLCLVISEFKELGFGVVPGKQTMVSIQEQRVTFLPPPWGVCDSGSDKSDYLFYDTYSIPSCRLRMVFKSIVLIWLKSYGRNSRVVWPS